MDSTDAPTVDEQVYTDLLATPIGFVEEVLKMPLYGWQDRALAPLEGVCNRKKIAVVTPNGSGKSERVVAGAALYWCAVHPRGTVVITTKDSRQLDEQIWPAIERHKSKFEGWKFQDRYVETPTGGRIIGFTTDDAGRAEGWHKDGDIVGPLLFICDEAKSIDEKIFTAIDRCTWNALLLTSSPGLKMGRFYNAFTKDRASYTCVEVGLKDCPHIPKEKIDDIIATYGADHPFKKSAVDGEFMDEDDASRFVFPLSLITESNSTTIEKRRGDRVAFCDFAAGGDENVFCLRDGNHITEMVTWKERNTMSACGRFIMLFRRHGLKAEEIFGDEGGMGISMCDALQEAGWPINRVNNQAAAFVSDRFVNRGAEMWHATAMAVRRGEVVLPKDDVLVAQLTTRMTKPDSKGRLGVESKDDLRKRSIPSPDRADAVCGAFANNPIVVKAYTKADPNLGWIERAFEETEGSGIPGAFAGL